MLNIGSPLLNKGVDLDTEGLEFPLHAVVENHTGQDIRYQGLGFTAICRRDDSEVTFVSMDSLKRFLSDSEALADLNKWERFLTVTFQDSKSVESDEESTESNGNDDSISQSTAESEVNETSANEAPDNNSESQSRLDLIVDAIGLLDPESDDYTQTGKPDVSAINRVADFEHNVTAKERDTALEIIKGNG